MRTRRLLVFGALALLAAAAAWNIGAAANDPWEGKRAPAFTVRDLSGHEIRLADLAGKKVVWLNFWGLRCGPCVKEMPALQKLYEKYGPKGLVVVGVNTDGVDGDFIRKSFVDRAELKAAGITFPLVTDSDFKVADGYELAGAPLNVLIDRKGVIRFRHEGYEPGDEQQYGKLIEKTLGR